MSVWDDDVLAASMEEALGATAGGSRGTTGEEGYLFPARA